MSPLTSTNASTRQIEHEEPESSADKLTRAQYALARWRAQDDHFQGLYRTWSRAILFLVGKHWHQWDPIKKRHVPEQHVPRWRQRPVTNLVYAVYRSALSKLTKQKPTFEVVPPSGDSEDREAASIGEALLQHLWRKLAITKVLKRGIGWLLTTSVCYVRVNWDPEAGAKHPKTVPSPDDESLEVASDDEGKPKAREDGSYVPAEEADALSEGEIALELISPMSVRLNPDATSLDDAEEVYIGILWPKDRAAKHFEIDVAELAGGENEDLTEFEDAIASAAGAPLDAFSAGADKSDAIGDRVLVLEYHRKPCDDYPQGRYWVQVGAAWASDEEPLPHGFWPPIVGAEDTPIPGQPVGVGLLGQAVPLNEQYNTITAHIREHQVTMSRGGKWIVAPADRNIKLTSDPNQVVESKGYPDGHPPFQAVMQSLPGEVYKERERVMTDLQVVTSLGEVGLSQRPEGTSSGRAFLVLQEQVDSVLTPLLFEVEGMLEEIGRRMLVLAQQYYREPRTVAIRGQQGAWEIRSFMGADLTDGLDVRVQAGSMFPWSKSARLDTALSIIEKLPTLVTNPDGSINKQQLARYLDVGGVQAFESEQDPDLIEIEREHAMFAQYDPTAGRLELPELGFWQDHAKHYAEHTTFLKTDMGRFQKWPEEAQQAFLQHVLQTLQTVQGVVEQMAPGVAPEGGGAPQGGAPGGGALGVEGSPEANTQEQQAPDDLQLTSNDFAAAEPAGLGG